MQEGAYGGYRSGKSSKMTSADGRSFLTAQATLQRVTIPEHPAVFSPENLFQKTQAVQTRRQNLIKVHYLRRQLPHPPSLKRFGAGDFVDCGGRDDPRVVRCRSRDLDHPHRQRWSYVVCRRRLCAYVRQDVAETDVRLRPQSTAPVSPWTQHADGTYLKTWQSLRLSGLSWAHGRDRSTRGLSMARCSPAPAYTLRATSTARADVARSASSWAL